MSCLSFGVRAADSNARPISIHDRLLLNGVSLNGRQRVEVLLVSRLGAVDRLKDVVEKMGGTIRYVERAIGYLRIDVPVETLANILANSEIDAYHIASRTTWENDSQARLVADIGRMGDIRPTLPSTPVSPDQSLPSLTPAAAKQPGYTGVEGTGIERWMSEHPTYDGRGVTIAILETAQLDYSLPIFSHAKTLEGRDIAKIAGVLNAISSDEFDGTRVPLTIRLDGNETRVKIDGRTFILPRVGKYLFGYLSMTPSPTIVERFGVLRSLASDEIWIDTNGDADFRNEHSMVSVERNFEVGVLKMSYPRKADASFVVTAGEAPSDVHVYMARGDHATMTASVAAGNRSADGLASGVAPAARILPVRVLTPDQRASDFIEGVLAAAARPDVDIISSSVGIRPITDSEKDLLGLILRRTTEKYGKPIFQSAGNSGARLSVALGSSGGDLSVGGAISPATWAALNGAGRLPAIQVSPISAAGPALDGGLKPDFLAPLWRIAGEPCEFGLTSSNLEVLPKHAPTLTLPRCYMVSDGTSSSAPFAAGMTALLVSAAKQTGVDHSCRNLVRSLRAGARFLPNAQAYEQGTGLLDLEGAWQELQRGVVTPRISVRAEVDRPLTPYTTGGTAGVGLFETEGWTATSSGVRTIELRREDGPSAPTRYRLSWTGNDETFSTAPEMTLPLQQWVRLPITVKPRTVGAHSAILNLHEPATGAIVLRSLATIIAAESLTSPPYTARFEGRLALLRSTSHFWRVPANTAALSLELTVTRGSIQTGLVASHGLSMHLFDKYPSVSVQRTLSPGTYHFVLPDPAAGTWSLYVANRSAVREDKTEKVSTEDAEYALSVRAYDTSMKLEATGTRQALVLSNHGVQLSDPVIKQSWGRLSSHRVGTRSDGLLKPIEIEVPENSSALVLRARSEERGGNRAHRNGVDLYLYDCTSGECFLHDMGIPIANEQHVTVRMPHVGRWVAMVNGSPSFPSTEGASLDVLVIANQGSEVTNLGSSLTSSEERLVQTYAHDEAKPFEDAVCVYEIFDRALERAETFEPWVSKQDLARLSSTRPVALGILVRSPEATKKENSAPAMP
jgi:subtilisin family serine protease